MNRALLADIKSTSERKMIHFRCPGCDDVHSVAINGPSAWGWNGRLDLPTFWPSVLVRYGHLPDGGPMGTDPVCHSFVVDGQIQFLGDCTHALAGQTVDLPEWTTGD